LGIANITDPPTARNVVNDKITHQERLQSALIPNDKPPLPSGTGGDGGDQDSCAAFGFLRGIKDTSGSLEFRLRSGNSMWFPYSWLGPWRFNPSEGLLLKFSGDVVYLVLIRGSNLDKPLADGSINLTSGGLQRCRVLWVREMTEEEIENVGETGPTIDRIKIGEFTNHESRREWLQKRAPAFLDDPS
jgi:hypothetical protein